ncbi:MAG: SoxR reducing system RseC family protein [Prevotellaceae bacterium]|jgi:sigma-E factor negative regulatory protein RseC|nr:SoxR reducing system RseC family protein [Prevotellaceae bacterium]
MPQFQPIEHKGTIASLDGSMASVEIVQTSSCAGCRAKTICSVSGQKEKLIRLSLPSGQSWAVGEEVVVSLRGSMGFKAVFLAYVVPLIALLSALFTLSSLGLPDWVTGLSAIAFSLFCYFLVWIFRDRIGKEYIFVLKKLQFI